MTEWCLFGYLDVLEVYMYCGIIAKQMKQIFVTDIIKQIVLTNFEWTDSWFDIFGT